MYVNDKLFLKNIIGRGSYGDVYLGLDPITKKQYAVKKISKKQLKSKTIYQYFNNEIFILRHVNHPNIVKFISLEETVTDYYLVTEYCNGGSLEQALSIQSHLNKKPFSEEIIIYFIKSVVQGVNYLNKQGLIHRDIKSDNILLNYVQEEDFINKNYLNAQIKIIDLGFARYLEQNELAGSLVGTPMYMEPGILKNFMTSKNRVIQGFYDQKVDVWSIGILTYEMLIGVLPFNAKDINGLYDTVKAREFCVPDKYDKPLHLTEGAIDFIDKTLNIDINKRPLPNELIKDNWLNSKHDILKVYELKSSEEIKKTKDKTAFSSFWKPKFKKVPILFTKLNNNDRYNSMEKSMGNHIFHSNKIGTQYFQLKEENDYNSSNCNLNSMGNTNRLKANNKYSDMYKNNALNNTNKKTKVSQEKSKETSFTNYNTRGSIENSKLIYTKKYDKNQSFKAPLKLNPKKPEKPLNKVRSLETDRVQSNIINNSGIIDDDESNVVNLSNKDNNIKLSLENQTEFKKNFKTLNQKLDIKTNYGHYREPNSFTNRTKAPMDTKLNIDTSNVYKQSEANKKTPKETKERKQDLHIPNKTELKPKFNFSKDFDTYFKKPNNKALKSKKNLETEENYVSNNIKLNYVNFISFNFNNDINNQIKSLPRRGISPVKEKNGNKDNNTTVSQTSIKKKISRARGLRYSGDLNENSDIEPVMEDERLEDYEL